ncbi:hypothetical protein ACWD26_21520 [Streptomyces sp. NPDC002787]
MDHANRVSQARFACRSCGFVDHADRNSSRNIRARAWELWRCGAQSTAPDPLPQPGAWDRTQTQRHSQWRPLCNPGTLSPGSLTVPNRSARAVRVRGLRVRHMT